MNPTAVRLSNRTEKALLAGRKVVITGTPFGERTAWHVRKVVVKVTPWDLS